MDHGTDGVQHANAGKEYVIVPELLTAKQASKLACCSERTLWAWSRSGHAPPPIKIGDGVRPAVRYRRSDLMKWIEAGCPRRGAVPRPSRN